MSATTILSDNGVTSGSAGVKTSGGTDGTLQLQTTTAGGTATTALSIDNSQVITFTNQPTYTGGTANGVAYLNGSKVLTTGSALTFDGTTLTNTRNTTDGTAAALTLNNSGATGSYATLNLNAGSVTYQQFADAAGNAIGTAGVMFRTTSNHPLVWGVNSSEAMRLTSTGLGIGTSSPANPTGGKGFEISNASGASIRATSSTTYLDLQAGSSANYILSNGAYPLLFYTNGSERARIDSSGNLLVGTTSSSIKLDVIASGSGSGKCVFRALADNGQILLGNAGTFDSYLDSNQWIFRTSPQNGQVERARIDSSGNLLVGTTSGGAKFRVLGDAESNGRRSELYIGWSGAGGVPENYYDADRHIFRSGSGVSEYGRFDSSGKLLVGTTSATVGSAHHLITASNELNLAASTTDNTIYFNYRAGTTLTALRFMSGTGTTSYVACYGTSFTNSSDYRIKTDIQEVGSVLPKVAQLRPVNYIKKGVEGREFGLIAHEAQEVFPDMVSGEKDAVDEDGDMEIQGIDYAQLSTILVKAIQEQQTIIEQLKADVAALKGQA